MTEVTVFVDLPNDETRTVALGASDHEELNPSTQYHVEWEALPTKRHMPGDEPETPGTGEDGWGIYLAEDEGDGYFAWLPHRDAARFIVEEHNLAVRAATIEDDDPIASVTLTSQSGNFPAGTEVEIGPGEQPPHA